MARIVEYYVEGDGREWKMEWSGRVDGVGDKKEWWRGKEWKNEWEWELERKEGRGRGRRRGTGRGSGRWR